MKNFHRQIIVLLLAFTLSFPSGVLAQETNPDSLQYYLERADTLHDLHVAQGSKINDIADRTNSVIAEFATVWSFAGVAVLTGLIAIGIKPRMINPSRLPLLSLSELEILSNPQRLEAYVKLHNETMANFETLSRKHSPTYAAINTKNYSLLSERFPHLDRLLTNIEIALDFQNHDHRFDSIVARELHFYNSFRRFGIDPTPAEVRQLIRVLSLSNDVELFFEESRYKNLVRAIRSEKLGVEVAQEMVTRLHSDVFLDDHFRSFEKDYVTSQGCYRDHTIGENVREAGIINNLTHEKTATLKEINYQHVLKTTRRSYRYEIKGMGAMFLVGFAVGAIVYFCMKDTDEQPTVQNQLNLSDEDILAMSENDREGFIHLLKTDKILAATFAWLYHIITKADRELAEFDRITTGK